MGIKSGEIKSAVSVNSVDGVVADSASPGEASGQDPFDNVAIKTAELREAIGKTEDNAGSAAVVGPFLKTAEFLARYHQLPFAQAAAERSLPSDYEQRGKAILARLLMTLGMKSRIVLRKLNAIDPMVLPCVVFGRDGNPLVLTALSSSNRTATIVDLVQGNFSTEIPLRKLQRAIGREILLVTADGDITASRMDRNVLSGPAVAGHWLWGPIRRTSGAWLQILFAALGINIFALALPIFVMNVYDRVIPNFATVTLWTLATGVGIALLLDLMLKLVRTSVLETAGRRIDLQVASSLFQQALNIKLLDRRGGAAGISSQIRDFESVRDFFTSASFVALIDLLFIGIFVTVLWMIVGPIAVVPLVAVPLVIVIALIAQAPIGASIAQSQQLAAKKNLVLIETLLGIETVKSVNGEGEMLREWENAAAATARINGKTRFWSNFAVNSTMLIQQVVSVVILVWGVYLVSDGAITVGGLIASNILAGRVLAPLGNISQTLIRAQQALKSLSSISSYMKLPVESSDRAISELRVQRGSIEFDKVSFTYPEAKVPALSEVSLKFEAGESVGILGRVGSGKTTLGKMFVNLIEADSGLVLVDGHAIQQYDTSVLREGIGYLPQDPEMFTGTIRENIVLGRPNATEDEIKEALYFAGMDYFIAHNPEGLNQFIGEKGNRLSGGQRQAISLARLLLRKPRMLFLDEPTNAMDNATEQVVIERFRELQKRGVALVISTHRNSLVEVTQKLVILDKGKLVVSGPRDKVLAHLAGGSATGTQKQGR